MSFQEKRTIVSLIGTILISVFYFAWLYQKYQEAGSAAANDFHFWGSAILGYIAVQIVLKIIIFILFSIINAVITRQVEPDIVDELDNLINLKSTRNFYHVFMLGFALSIGTQVIDQPPQVMFLALMATMLVAGVTLDVSQLFYYRRGV